MDGKARLPPWPASAACSISRRGSPSQLAARPRSVKLQLVAAPSKRLARACVALSGSTLVVFFVALFGVPCSVGCGLLCDGSYGCSEGAAITIHVKESAPVLEGAELVLCRDDTCEVAALTSANGHTVAFAADAGLFARGELEDVNDGWSRIGLTVVKGFRDVESLSFRVAHPDGGPVLLDVQRTATFVKVEPDGRCGASCKVAGFDIHPTTRSGLTCGTTTCSSGITLRGTVRANLYRRRDVELTVCKNDVCARSSIDPTGIMHMVGALTATGDIGGPDENEAGVYIDVPIEPLAVANGDHVTAGAYLDSQPLVTFEGVVDYDESWPNGKDCDDVPCRRKSLELRPVK